MEFRKMVMITLYAKQKKRHRCTEQTFGLCGRRRGWVGCFERTACILSIVKQITSPGGMHETIAWTWCTGKTQRNRVEREVGGGSEWGIHVTPWLIHVNVWQNPLKCCEVISLQLIKANKWTNKWKKRCCIYEHIINCLKYPVWFSQWLQNLQWYPISFLIFNFFNV